MIAYKFIFMDLIEVVVFERTYSRAKIKAAYKKMMIFNHEGHNQLTIKSGGRATELDATKE